MEEADKDFLGRHFWREMRVRMRPVIDRKRKVSLSLSNKDAVVAVEQVQSKVGLHTDCHPGDGFFWFLGNRDV